MASWLERVAVEVPKDLESSDFGSSSTGAYATRVRLRLCDGHELAAEGMTAKGFPGRAIDWPDLVAKYRECAGYTLGPAQVERSFALIEAIDQLPDVRELTAALATSGAGTCRE